MKSGVKTATASAKKIASPGDRSMAFGEEFEITAEAKLSLWAVAEKFECEMGFGALDDVIRYWGKEHPKSQYFSDPEKQVFLYLFKKIRRNGNGQRKPAGQLRLFEGHLESTGRR